MPKSARKSSVLFFAVLLVGLVLFGAPQTAEAANWRDLTGRVAPDLPFQETTSGLAGGSRISSFRGRSVVLLVFWLRDCPHCARELQKVQRAHDRWGSAGLQVISVVHKFTLGEIEPVMRQRRWTFPVARDPAGRLASTYGGGRRPGYYIIGIDGRVKASNGMPDAVLQMEVGRWRLSELGAFPPQLSAARSLVYAAGPYGRGDYGPALRSAEAVGAAAGAGDNVTSAVERLAEIARRKLESEIHRAEGWYRGGYVKAARDLYRTMVTTYAGTSLEGRARALHDAFLARAGGR